jgi:hypothetical protein
MPTTSIKISQLDPIASLTGSDFFPIDQSSSIKTYRASLTQLQNLFSTGSFTGSFTGSILGTGTSPQFVGTSSWAISSSRSISSSYSDFSNSSSYALSSSRATTASYALNSNAGDLSGGGTLNYIPLWTGNKTLGSTSNFYYETSPNYFTSTQDLKIQKSNPALFVTGSDLGYVAVRCTYNSSLMLQSSQSASRDSWALIVNADDANAAFLAASPSTAYDIRGTIDLVSYSGSSQFVSKQVTGEATPVSYVMKSRSNGLYFWPEKGSQSLSRDGTFNIGVSPSTINTSSRLTIEVFSGSSASNPQTYHLSKAIEVRYGSSSLNTTFCVSSSGQVIATGYSGSNFNAVSFYGSASYALSSSNAVTASYALSSSHATYAASASGTLGGSGFAGLDSSIFTSSVSVGSLNSYLNGYYSINHGFGSSPSLVRVTLICHTPDQEYIANDEISVEQLHDEESGISLDEERPISTIWSNTTVAAVSWASPAGGDVYAHDKTGGRIQIDPTYWKIKIRTWK